MSARWDPGIRAFRAHWRHAPMPQQTFETLEREFADENDVCVDAAPRDLLLPRLMSGVARVTDAEKLAEAAL